MLTNLVPFAALSKKGVFSYLKKKKLNNKGLEWWLQICDSEFQLEYSTLKMPPIVVFIYERAAFKKVFCPEDPGR